ncbi:MAG: tyramine oxidase [Rhizobiales bacterium]|nr:tyramine oxidase [Hyphomicrobiales bacterium]NRB14766.1 tyramine oxidase [Hyphomicrobiales bacterium]
MNNIFKFISILILSISPTTVLAVVTHPMDALTADELVQTIAILKQQNIADDATQYPYIGLLEMPKKILKTWQKGDPITRMAKIVLYKNQRTYEVELNLSTASIISQTHIKNVQPSVMSGEWHIARELTLKDADFLAALKKRGIANLDNVYCSPNPAGHFAKKNYGFKRIFKVPCYERSHSKNHLYGRPIEGLFAVVDVEAKQVLEIVDTGVIPTPAPIFDYESGSNNRPALNAVFSISPQGANYKITDGVSIEWQNWQFHARVDKRVGTIISMVKFNDAGRLRDVAYQMSLAEMFVPYQDPSENWYYRTFLDNGEFGLGLLASSLTPGADCPVAATYLTINLPNDDGDVFQIERAVCIFERNIGDPLWRHGISGEYSNQTRPQVELVVRTIPVLGNYDYIIDFVFQQTGNIDIRIGASGILAAKGAKSLTMDDLSAAEDTQYGSLIAPAIVGPNHSHHFSFRLDLDVDGSNNQLVTDIVELVELPKDSVRRSIWVRKQLNITKEGGISVNQSEKQWRVINPNKKTKLKHNPSYQLILGHQGTSISTEDDSQKRALFTLNPLWVSRYNPKELYSAGDYPNQSQGGEGIVKFVEDGQDIQNQDIVLWPTIGFDHIPRTEDWPIMPTMFMKLTLRPYNFFDQNPTMDVPEFFKPLEPIIQPPVTEINNP